MNLTVLFERVALYPVPLIVTDVPTAPAAGEKPEMVGTTEKLVELVAVCPPTVTVIVPLPDAPLGTVTVRLVEVEAETIAVTPLNLTVLFEGVVPSKFSPVMVTVDPTAPEAGVKLEITGAATKEEALVADCPPTITEIVPVVVPLGTVTVRLVEVDAETVAATPLNLTVLFERVALYPVPLIVTVVPTAPAAGEKPEMVGTTEKLVELVAVCPPTVTVIVPLPLALLGTATVRVVEVDAETVAATPLNLTVLFEGVVPSKFSPVMVTVEPTTPEAGVKLEITGAATKEEALVADWPPTVTEIVPVVVLLGTVTVRLVEVDAETVAVTPLNLTVLFEGVVPSKFNPVMVTVEPTAPEAGVKFEITGAATKEEALVADCPPTVTKIVPVVVPLGTVTARLVEVDAETVAATPLNLTVLFERVALYPVPLIVTVVPTAPAAGEKPEIVGTTEKLVGLVAVCPPTVTVIVPLPLALLGTVTVRVVEVDAETVAATPLNLTILLESVAPS